MENYILKIMKGYKNFIKLKINVLTKNVTKFLKNEKKIQFLLNG